MNKYDFIDQLGLLNIGLKRFTVRLVEHTDSWAEAFHLVSEVIRPAIAGATIHHIGSTAIPGCIAKPILDIGIGYGDHSDFREEAAALSRLGFTSKGEYGVERRSFFTFYSDDERFDYIHIHAYRCDDSKLRAHLEFRDAHRGNAHLVQEYNALKRGLIESGISRQDYPAAKSGYIQHVLESAL